MTTKIADFVFATSVPRNSSLDEELTFGVGTPLYAAPEIYSECYNQKVDIYW